MYAPRAGRRYRLVFGVVARALSGRDFIGYCCTRGPGLLFAYFIVRVKVERLERIYVLMFAEQPNLTDKKKNKKIRRPSYVFRGFPYVRFAFVANSLAGKTPER